MSRSILRVAVALLSSVLAAQQPSSWVQLTPPGGAAAANLSTLAQSGRFGRLALYRSGQFLRVFSTVTGRWHEHVPSFGTTPRLYDEILLVPESDRWTALSARRGVFETLFVDQPNTTVQCEGTIAVVRHLGTVHLFSAFTGRWHTRAVPANWSIGLGERVAVFSAPNNTTSFTGHTVFDAVTGSFHDLAAPSTDRLLAASYSASTGLAVFLRPDQSGYVATWSAQQPVWQFHPATAQFPLFNLGGGGPGGADFVSVWDVAYSGLTNTLTVLGDDVSPSNEGLVATARDTTTGLYRVMSAMYGTWFPVPAGSMARYGSTETRSIRLFANGSQTHAFDAATNAFATIGYSMGQFAERGYEGRGYAALWDDVGLAHIYSSRSGQWLPTPTDVLPNSGGWATPTSLLLGTTTGFVAFSARTESFVPLVGTGLQSQQYSAVNAANGTTHVFDERTARWLSTPTLPLRSFNDHTGFAMAGATSATGYCANASRLETIALPEPALFVQALDGGAVVRTQNHLFAFAGTPEDLSLQGWPAEGAACAPGSTWRHQMRLAPGHVAIHAVGPRTSGPVAFAPFGTLWLDPQQVALQQFVVAAPGEERVEFATPIPSLAVLRGTEWTVQALVLPPVGTAYLTAPSSLLLF